MAPPSAPRQWVRIIGLQSRPDLNGRVGWTVSTTSSERWVVRIACSNSTMALRPEKLQRISAPLRLQARDRLWAMVVQKLFRRLDSIDSIGANHARQCVWSFLYDPVELVIVKMRNSSRPFPPFSLGLMFMAEEVHPIVESFSMQTGHRLHDHPAVWTERSVGATTGLPDQLPLHFLHGASQATGSPMAHYFLKDLSLWWYLWDGLALPYLSDASTLRGSLFQLCTLDDQDGRCNVPSFCGVCMRSKAITVASLECGWVAQHDMKSTVSVYNFITRMLLGSCAVSHVVDDGELWVVAYNHVVVVSSQSVLDVIRILQSGSGKRCSPEFADVTWEASINLQRAGTFSSHACDMPLAPIGLNDSRCAIISERSYSGGGGERSYSGGGGPLLNLYALSRQHIREKPLAVVRPLSCDKFFSVTMTSDKLFTIEAMVHGKAGLCGNDVGQLWRRMDFAGPCQAVVRDAVDVFAPPLFVVQLEHVGCDFVFARRNLFKNYAIFLRRQTSFEHAIVQEHLGECIQEIHHEDDEAPVDIKPSEADELVRAQWESMIMCNSQEHHDSFENATGAIAKVITFHRHPRCLDMALLRSALGERMVAAGLEVQPAWANGAKILVPCLTEEVWEDAKVHLVLSPYHVVICDEDCEALMSILQGIPYKNRPRLKRDVGPTPVLDPRHVSLFQDLSAASDSVSTDSEQDETMFPGSQQESAEFATLDNLDPDDARLHSVWIEGLRSSIESGRRIYLNTMNTFLNVPEVPELTPRSMMTQSDMNGRHCANPRIWPLI